MVNINVHVLKFFMRFIPLNDLLHGMVKRTPMTVQMQGYKSLCVYWRVSWSLNVCHTPSNYPSRKFPRECLVCLRKVGARQHIVQPVWKAISVGHSTVLHYPGCKFPFPELDGPGRHYTKWPCSDRTLFGHQG